MATAEDPQYSLLTQLLEQQTVVSKKLSELKPSRFERVATVLGFAVDTWSAVDIISRIVTFVLSTVATLSVLTATTGGNTATVFLTNIKLTPWHALIPWSLMTFCCLAFARTFYNKNIKEIGKPFWEFVFKDLLFGFNNIRLSLPIFCCIVVLLGIFAAGDALAPTIVTIGVLGVFLFYIFIWSASDMQLRNERFIEQANEDWSSWQQRIEKELEGKQWITSNDFKDIIQRYNVNHNTIHILMAKYAMFNPVIAKYGDVYTKDRTQIIAVNVLINKRSIPKSKFYY